MIAPQRPVLGAIAVVCHLLDGAAHVILVQRGKAPNRGAWGFPGGHVEWGETVAEAAVRELAEETSVIAEATETLPPLDVIQRNATGKVDMHYVLSAVLCSYQTGTPTPLDDAADARWVDVDTIEDLGLDLLPQVADVARAAQARLVRCDSTRNAPTA